MKASQNTLWILRRFQPKFWAMPKTYCKSVSACGTRWATKNPPSGFLVALCISSTVYKYHKRKKDLQAKKQCLHLFFFNGRL